MSDAVDITMEDVVNQYRDEVIKLMGEKILLQAAVKILGEAQADYQAQIRQLTEDLTAAVNEVARVNEAAEQAEETEQLDEKYLPPPLKPVTLSPEHHIQYTHGRDSNGD